MASRICYFSVFVSSLCACFGVSRAADRITLTSTMVIEGQVVRETPGDPLVAINTGGKLLLLNRSEISAIDLDDEGRTEYQRRLNDIKIDKAPAHFELYKWAKTQRLYDYADRELSATLRADPSHAEARKIAFAPAKLSKPTPNPIGVNAQAVVDDGPVIGLRPVPHAQRLSSEYDEKVFAYCKALRSISAADEKERKAALAALSADRNKATEAVVSYLDPSRDIDEQTRLAALAGIEVLKPASAEISKRLAQIAIADPYIPVRKEAVALIKSRNDEGAMNHLVNAYISAFAEEGGQVRDPILKGAAGEALEGLGDKRIYSAMFYRATMEVRTAVSELSNFATRQIDSYTVNSGAQVSVIVPLSFPIQFPELKLTSIKTTVCAPCAAMSSLTGQNFGNDLDAWAKWIRMQK